MARIIDTQRKLLIQHGLLEDIKEAGEECGSLTAALAAPDWTLLDRELSPLFKQVKFCLLFGEEEVPELAAANELSRLFPLLSSDCPDLKEKLAAGRLAVSFSSQKESNFFLLTGKDQYRFYWGQGATYFLSSGEKTGDDWAMVQQLVKELTAKARDILDKEIYQGYLDLAEDKRSQYLLEVSGLADKMAEAPLKDFKEATRLGQLGQSQAGVSFKKTAKLLRFKSGIDKENLTGKKILADEELSKRLSQIVFGEGNENGEAIVLPDEKAHYPRPLYLQDPVTGTILEKPAIDSYQEEPVAIQKPTRQDVSAIFDIIRFYRDRKQDNESQAAFSFLMYVLESGSIWKIRQAIDERNGIVEDVPIVAGLVGQGETGKSTLLKIASNLTIGNTKEIVQASSEDKLFGMTAAVRKKLLSGKSLSKQDRVSAYSSNPKVINKNIWNFTDHYMDEDQVITPICIDDPEVSLFSSSAAQSFLKKRSNRHGEKLGVEPVAIFSMNSKGKDIELLTEVGRRGYVISQGNQFRKKTDADIHFFEYLDGNTDNHGHWLNNTLFLYLTRQIDRWLEEMDDEDYLKLKHDFLYPVKHAFWQLVEEYGLVNTETKCYFHMKNYNIVEDLGRRNWSILLHDEATLREITFTRDNPECMIPARVFPNKDNDINRYFAYLPASAEICKTFDSQGLTVKMANMDLWQGNHLLTERYEKETGIAAERFEMEKARAAAEVQGQIMGENIAPYLKKNAEMMDQMMKVTEQNARLLAEKEAQAEKQQQAEAEKKEQADQIQKLQDELAQAKEAAEAAKSEEKKPRGFFDRFFK
ncbi:hypothetical protein ACXO4K_03980 [Lactobacillus delbrueckii subsp. bulgaricus]|nr:hypothetical protein [Lactobacillus delbrueckii subsp. bulgaricus]